MPSADTIVPRDGYNEIAIDLIAQKMIRIPIFFLMYATLEACAASMVPIRDMA